VKKKRGESVLFFCLIPLPNGPTLVWHTLQTNVRDFTSLLEHSSSLLQDLTIVDPIIEEGELFELLEAVLTKSYRRTFSSRRDISGYIDAFFPKLGKRM
jgi:hypothetical protein